MKLPLYLLFLLLSGNIITAQTNTPSPVSFPKDFIGNWKGNMEWTPLGKASQIVLMELRIHPSKDSIGQYTWNIIYQTSGKDNRPYLLKAVDSAKGHWQIDEVNGIILDQYWIANRFSGAFTVQQTTINNNYWIENGKLHVEFISYSKKAIATTGKGNDENPHVDSYAIKSYQKAILSRQ